MDKDPELNNRNHLFESTTKSISSYGSSNQYIGSLGEAYFSRQQSTARIASIWNLCLWSDYINEHDFVLDFGCGGGNLLSILPGKHKVGVDINPAARSQAEKYGLEVYPTLDDVPFQKFTKVISSHALEHIPHPLFALQNLTKYLDQSGWLIILLPMDDWRTKTHRIYEQGNKDHHLYNWTPQNIGNLLNEAGYTVVNIEVVTDTLPPFLKLVQLLQGRIFLRKAIGRALGFLMKRRQLFAVASISVNKC